MIETPWLTLAEAAEFLRYPTDRKGLKAFWMFAARANLPRVKRGRALLFDRRDIEDWLKRRQVG
jgi:hypothetical protein